MLRERGAQVILGNHEEGFLGPHGARARAADWIDRSLLTGSPSGRTGSN